MKDSDDDDNGDSVYSLKSKKDTDCQYNPNKQEQSEEDTDTDYEFKMANTISKSKNKGFNPLEDEKEFSESSDEDSDSDYIEGFSHMDFEDNSNSEGSYSPDSGETLSCTLTTTNVKPKVTKPKKKVKPKIKNPERYLDNPKNVFFETSIKNRLFELLVHAQLVKDYGLRFQDKVCYIDPKGELEAKTAKWKSTQVCI
ncbi:unnamed protein product [Arabis nemorensis]|uniref:Uncharacterized protein n=1 Tax=Arabis nemorensis TaxID=586526 RepID=A0A565CFE2_9BRAS|nr:unnamed protein product [Arabis nemorensis]